MAKQSSKTKLKQVGKPKPLADQVYDLLLNLNTSPRMPPGSRLSVDALVRELNVSQTPIRQALVRLQTQGLVERELNVGYSTPSLPDASELNDIFAFRLMIEPQAAGLAAEKTNAPHADALEKLAQDMEAISADSSLGNYGRFAAKDNTFHELILTQAGNRVALDAIQRLNVHNHLFRLYFHRSVTDDANHEHRAILEAIKSGVGQSASDAMRRHIEASYKRLEPHF
ncbi:GntR family transcriptional regulator [Cognatishimia sp. WU-CL00825]|uniref:GntR family transcriptional regulator n=1 Tax=Cognatishimia sp. WU-CL00825 TaxID=3127658 RepID=UPI00310C4E6E